VQYVPDRVTESRQWLSIGIPRVQYCLGQRRRGGKKERREDFNPLLPSVKKTKTQRVLKSLGKGIRKYP